MKNLGAWIIVMVLFFSGCPVTPIDDTYIPDLIDTGTINLDNQLFLLQDQTVQFVTNDPAYHSSLGYTLWALFDQDDEEFVAFEATVSKSSGHDSAGYGVVLAYREDEDFGPVMLVVMINNRREYVVGQVVDFLFEEVVSWTSTTKLVSGYNVQNVIRVSYDVDTTDYTLFFNDQQERTFRIAQAPYFTEGRPGYLVVISPADEFPDNPVSVRFTRSE